MKMTLLFQFMIVATVSLCPHLIAGAQTARGQDRGGGDTQIYLEADERLELQATEEARRLQKQADDVVRAKYVKYLSRKIADGSFKTDVLAVVNDPDFRASLPEATAKLFDALLAQGLVEDIHQSSYSLQASCKDFKGQPKTLSTAIGSSSNPKIGAPICVDMGMFVDQYSAKFSNLKQVTEKNERLYRLAPYPFWMLFGLFMHDHARHFGVGDEDHTFAAQFSRALFAYNMKGQNTLAESRELVTTVDQNGYEVLTLRVPEYTPLNRKLGVDVVLDPTSECAKNGSRILLEPFAIRMPEYFSISAEQRARIGAFCHPQAFAQGDTSMKGSKVRIFDLKSKETLVEAKLRTDSRVVFVRFEKGSKLAFLSGLGGQGVALRGDNFNSPFAEFDQDSN